MKPRDEPFVPVKALPLSRGIPGRVKQQQVVGTSQVEANTASFQWQQQDIRCVRGILVKQIDDISPEKYESCTFPLIDES